ncbi:stemmadenine O-acetyltransferase [Manihot esculenta]|uniref:Uncharacterized protein n=2 Tax=Manihot esculenta TaxID=3983 RepID=A0ACB7HK47_MANES|nr:stemmadenine O-acetyltransferase [Manihot esculenta]KAG8652650.1 hypothetical protein MANES_06G116000v8 [Manihot esculenta]
MLNEILVELPLYKKLHIQYLVLDENQPRTFYNFIFLICFREMEVQIISKEIVKPSSATPQHLSTYNLSLLDQLAPQIYVPIILFYSASRENSYRKYHHLKTSLSKTLTHFSPFAGRIKDGFSIDCNDEGASFIEANVAGEISMTLEESDVHKLEKLLPCNPYDVSSEISSRVLLAVQVNYFACGGMALSACIWHPIGDASALASFLTSWAAISRGATDDIEGVISDCTSLFPPQDVSSFSLRNFFNEDLLSKITMKRFLFDSSKIAALREEIGNSSCLDPPTRFEAVAALIWKAVMAETEEDQNGNETKANEINVAIIAVDLRKRMIPQLPKLSIGNIFQVTKAICSKNDEKLVDYNALATKLHESIGMVNNDFVRMIHGGGAYFQFLRKESEKHGENSNLTKLFGFSSWCRFPFYEVDFGWGKPTWVATPLKFHNVAIFLDSKDGEGIEAWVSLSEEHMMKFEQNPGICAYSSFKPST